MPGSQDGATAHMAEKRWTFLTNFSKIELYPKAGG